MSRTVALLLAVAGVVAAGIAVWHERRMQRHRQPGVGYREVTFRRDGGWCRADLFTPEGLAHQRRASRAGLVAVLCWLLALASVFLLMTLAIAVAGGPAPGGAARAVGHPPVMVA